ncbi:DUF6272 family protein [Desulfobacterales bacterium HSG16]|nr:DUF6272 family protein [Desulfobacterales bacterium HSG16]
MTEEKTFMIGDFIDSKGGEKFDLSSTLRLRAKSINQKKLWASKDRSAEFMGDIWSLFVDSEKEKQIQTVLHSVCVELIENSVKYGCQDHDYIITTDLCLKRDELLVYVVNKSDLSQIPDLQSSAQLILDTDNIRKLFKQKMKAAKAAKKQGESTSQLGFIRIIMQGVKLAWRIEMGSEIAVVTSLARLSLTRKDA